MTNTEPQTENTDERKPARQIVTDGDAGFVTLKGVTINVPLERGKKFEIKGVGTFNAVRVVFDDLDLDESLVPAAKHLWIRSQDPARQGKDTDEFMSVNHATGVVTIKAKERIGLKRVSPGARAKRVQSARKARDHALRAALNAGDIDKAKELAGLDDDTEILEWYDAQ